MRRNFAVALSFCLCATWLAGCGGRSGRRSLAQLIPADTLIVLFLDWQAVRGDTDLLKLVKGEELNNILGQLNVSEEAVTDLVVFGDGSDGAGGMTGMILSGSLDAQGVLASHKERGWREGIYGGREVYTSPTDGTRLVALDSDVLVFGTERGVQGAIRAESDSDAAFASNDEFKRLSKLFDIAEHPVSMMISFPRPLQDAADAALQVSSAVMDLAGIGPLGQLMSKIGYSRAVGCSIGHERESFPVEVVAIMKDEDAAALVSGGLTLLKGISTLAGHPPARSSEEANALQSLRDLSVSREGDVLSISLILSRRNLFPN